MGNVLGEKSLKDRICSGFIKSKRYAGHILRTFKAVSYMKHLTEKPRKDNGPVRVAFIVQMPEIWDKESPVFEAMLKDERFDPVLLVVPPYDMINDRISEYGAELDFFLSRYGTDRVIKAFEGKWVDIEKLGFEYVFYQ